MRVLYVNHTAEVSGGERSLLSLLGGAAAAASHARVASPPGALAQDDVQRLGLPVEHDRRHRRAACGFTPAHAPRARRDEPRGAARCAARRAGIARMLVHANSIRAGIVLGLARGVRGRAGRTRPRLPAAGPRSRAATMRLIAATANDGRRQLRLHRSLGARGSAPKAPLEVDLNPRRPCALRPRRASIARTPARASARRARGACCWGSSPSSARGRARTPRSKRSGCCASAAMDAHLLLIGSAKFTRPLDPVRQRSLRRRLRELIAGARARRPTSPGWASARTFPS